MKGFIFLSMISFVGYLSGQTALPQDTITEIDEIKFIRKLPITSEVINMERDLGSKSQGQDLPFLLKNQVAIESTSDAGNSVGYTGLRIRGVDGTRINVMLNGVPYNDSESQGTFFVDAPDVAASASQIVIQRGVGTSTNGVAAFGASIDILTKDPDAEAYFATQNSYGSFQTHRHAIEVGTGSLWDGKLRMMGKYSVIGSDGYIDRAFSKLDSYNFTAVYREGSTKVKLMTFGGNEKTYQAWNGISKEQYDSNPRYNPAGEIKDKDGNVVGIYDNETDNYNQQHYHLLWEEKFNPRWKLNTTVHYTRGEGYYENYKSNQKLEKYGIPPLVINGETITRADLIRNKGLDNRFYGVVSRLTASLDQWDLNFGLIGNRYQGAHYGSIPSGSYFTQLELPIEYYRNHATKDEISGYAKALYKTGDFEWFADAQLRSIGYQSIVDLASPEEAPEFDKQYTFFNPKMGVNFHWDDQLLYLSYAVANREPVRTDLKENPDVKSERLQDWELGYHYQQGNFHLNANLYYMVYKDQLILTGKLNDVGAAIHENTGKSYRRGIEVSSGYRFSPKLNATMNFALSQSKNIDYVLETESGLAHLGNTDISFSPNFIGNLAFNYSPTAQLAFTLQNKYVSSQYMNNTQKDLFQLKGYYLADFITAYKIQKRNTEVGFQLIVNNVLDTKYTNYGVDYGTPYYYGQAGINFMAGVSLRFK